MEDPGTSVEFLVVHVGFRAGNGVKEVLETLIRLGVLDEGVDMDNRSDDSALEAHIFDKVVLCQYEYNCMGAWLFQIH